MSPLSIWILPFLLIRNTLALRVIGCPPEPRSTAEARAKDQPPYDPGRPVWQRPSIVFAFLLALPVALVWVAFVVSVPVMLVLDKIDS